MRTQYLKYLFLVAIVSLWGFKEFADTNSDGSDIQVKTSEQHRLGMLDRTTERFRNGVVISSENALINTNGEVKVWNYKLFRNGKVVCSELKNNALPQHVAVRIYWNDKQPAVEEIDENGDGFFGLLLIFNSNGEPVEAFQRGKDNSVNLLRENEFTNLLDRLQLPMPK